MNREHDDRILEACLEELLGGQTPPDLTERIMQRVARQDDHEALPQANENVSAPLRPIATPQPNTFVSARSRRPTVFAWVAVGLAASLLLAVAALQGNRKDPDGQAEPIAQAPRPRVKAHPLAPSEAPKANLNSNQPMEGHEAVSPASASTPAADVPSEMPVAPQPPARQIEPAAPAEVLATSTPKQPAAPEQESSKDSLSTASRADAQIIASINEAIRRRWREEGIKPALAASDAEWCRRVYLDVIGRIPTLEETNRYLADRSPQKKTRLLDRLLESDDCIEQYALNWTNIWTALLVGRSGGREPDGLVNRAGLEQWLRRSFLTNKPYDQFTSELVSASGSNTPGEPDFNGAVNFVLDNLQERGMSATAKTARLFLGMQVQCTQCHNHPFNDWKQDQFWELNAFFRQARPQQARRDGDRVVTRLVDVNFAGENGNSLDEAEVYWEMRNGLMKASYPAFVDGTRISPHGDVEKVHRRQELARLIVRSPQLPRAMVNRLWAHFLGYGFTKAVDDLGPHNPPSHPELLDQLADDFAARGFDTKSLIRWITLSDPYSLSSRIPAKTKDDPAAGTVPLFSYFYLRQMRAEELYESLLVATGLDNTGGSYEDRQRRKAEWLEQFAIAFATEENDEATIFNGSISQALVMWNGDLMRQATSGAHGSFLHKLAAAETKPATKINQLFTAALSRKPTGGELQMAQQVWQNHSGDTHAALQDIWWVVLNTNEFILNH
jgi:hypothetical protein